MKAITDKARAEINQEPEDIGAAGNPDLSFDGPKIPKVDAVNKSGNRSIVLSKLPTKKLEKSISQFSVDHFGANEVSRLENNLKS